MGADGGICWVTVTGDLDRFTKLVEPLGLLYMDTYREDDNSEWMEKYGEPCGEVASYGTNQSTQGFLDLEEMLHEIFWWEKMGITFSGDYYPGMTFEEMIWASRTRPKDWYSGQSILEKVVLDSLAYWYPRENARPENLDLCDRQEHLLGMTILEWAEEVKSLIDIHSFGSEETWT